MDQALRNKLRSVVTQCRKLLEEAVAQVLQGQFGIYVSGKKDEVHVEDEGRMKNLSEEDKGYRRDIEAHLGHIEALGYRAKDSLAQLVREIAFTHLNRLCAYKMMEARAVWIGGQPFREAVSRGMKSQGFQFYLADHPEDKQRFDTGHQDVAYRHFLGWLGALLSEEIGVLFSPSDPANRLFPPQRVLDDVLALLNSDDLNDIWAVDETIGWVYQYFTPKELRDQVRKESAAPRNPYELAFRNQFFTPRYVVEFLTDNTLGRIWYEMRKGDTKLKDQCRYMVRRPSEIFQVEGQTPPEPTSNQEELSQEELLKQPVYIPYRRKKDPRELRILDPACGSGHFLLYCFYLLLIIYEEAYADPDIGPKLKEDYPTLDALRRDAPRLILAHNLHGIDIDLRATQIAALALWLCCQRAYGEMGLKQDRPKITKSNIVCAEPMPGENEMLKEFVAELQPNVLGHLVQIVFDKMKLGGEAGSLLKIEEELRSAIADIKKQWIAEAEQATDRKGRPLLFSRAEMQRLSKQTPQPQLFDFSEITDEQFWNEAEGQVLAALRNYAAHAANGGMLKKQLFAEDAERGFAFIDVCQKRFDVVLMNPPFGELTVECKKYLTASGVSRPLDAYAQFVFRAQSLSLEDSGSIGAILSKTFLSHAEFEPLRRSLIEYSTPLYALADLGPGVLDGAAVEAALVILLADSGNALVPFFDAESHSDKKTYLSLAQTEASHVYWRDRDSFLLRPGVPFSFKLNASTLSILHQSLTVQSICHLCWGLFTADDERFCRIWWEVEPREINRRWIAFAKGGETAPFFGDIDLVVDWNGDGKTILSQRSPDGRILARAPNKERFGHPGATYSSISSSGLRVRVLPAGAIFSIKGPGLFAEDGEEFWSLLEMLNTAPVSYLLSTLSVNRSAEINYVKRISIPGTWRTYFTGDRGRKATALLQQLASTKEQSRMFLRPALLSKDSDQNVETTATLLSDVFDDIEGCGANAFAQFGFDQEELSKRRLSYKQISSDARKADDASELISYSLGCVCGRWDARRIAPNSPVAGLADPLDCLPVSSPGMLLGQDGFPANEAPNGYPLRINLDGIIPDDPDHSDDIVRRVREVLELIWKDQAEAIEKETCEILGVKELRDYFRKPGKDGFWDDHVSRYSKSRRKAPIYWHLRSRDKNYGLWLYYHRLDKDILFKARQKYADPKIRLEQARLDSLRSQKTALGADAKAAKKIDKDMERQQDLLGELKDFADKLERAAKLNFGKQESLDSDILYDPDLNDGVVLNIAPLWELVPWKEAKSYWEELLEGKYEWSSMGKLLRKKGLVTSAGVQA